LVRWLPPLSLSIANTLFIYSANTKGGVAVEYGLSSGRWPIFLH
jgi:hypothetical protein